jgi:predicted transcriptional regulator
MPSSNLKQNVTVSLPVQTIRKAKVLAAKRDTSISKLLAEQIETLVDRNEAYEQAKRSALARLEKGYHMGGKITATRAELHER